MYLKRLTIRGFKSFASATEFDFEPGITAIVGPNGSGKSNVVDALAWVMGEQGAKSLRGATMTDVIFAGTPSRPALGRAEVTLTIDNTDGTLPIEFTEVTISRTLFRSGGSEYAINGAPVRLLDVQELLSDTGMGKQMHVIVGQGQLDQILQATPEIRRGFVEEAAGVLKHRRRRERAVRKLEATAANLARLTDLTAEVRRQLRPLGRQAELARQAAGIAAEVRDAKARLLADDLYQARTAWSDGQRRMDAQQQRRAEAERELELVRSRMTQIETRITALGPRITEAQTTWLALASLSERIRATSLIAADRLAAATDQPIRAQGRDPQQLDREAEEAAQQVRVIDHEVAVAQARLTQALDTRARTEAAEDAAAREYTAELRAATDRREGLSRLSSRLEGVRGRLETHRDELERLRQEHDAALALAEESDRRFAAKEITLAELSGGEAQLDETYEIAVHQGREAEEELTRHLERISVLQSRIAESSARVEALELTLVPRDGAAALLAEHPDEFIPLIEAIRVPASWRRALAATLGTLSEGLVVPDLDSAFDALQTLRVRDLGTATLFPPLAPRPVDRPRPGPAWARDLVEVDDSLTGLVDRLLDKVVWCDDVAEHQDLLEADDDLVLVDRQGTVLTGWRLSGGSLAQLSSIELTGELERTRRERQELRQELERHGFATAGLRTKLDEARRSQQIAEEALHASDARMTALAEELAVLGQSAAQARARAEQIQSSVDRVVKSVDATRIECAELEARLERARGEQVTEPDPVARDRAAVQARAARQAEMEARLGLRAAEERQRSAEARARGLQRAAAQERTDRAREAARRERLRRQSENASAVLVATGWLAERTQLALGLAEADRSRLEQARSQLEEELRRHRGIVEDRARVVEEIVASLHTEQLHRAELAVRLESLETRVREEMTMSPADLLSDFGPLIPIPVDDNGGPTSVAFVRAEQERRLRSAQRRLDALGAVNPLALEEFEAATQRHDFLTGQLEDLQATRKDLLDLIDEVDRRVQEVFAAAYVDVEKAFGEVFGKLFPGGVGRLVLTDPEDLSTSGIDIEATPAGKKVRRLSLLSGGERSLVAVAFLLALFIARPSPFYILDEVEAALDDVNLGRLLGIYEDLRRSSQLLVITHHKRTMEVADALYGVTMQGDGVSRVISQRITR